MRLKMLEDGRGLRPVQWLISRVVKKLSGNFVPPPMIVLSYRREIFGKPFCQVLHKALHGTAYWAKADAELMAAFVSNQNVCKF